MLSSSWPICIELKDKEKFMGTRESHFSKDDLKVGFFCPSAWPLETNSDTINIKHLLQWWNISVAFSKDEIVLETFLKQY